MRCESLADGIVELARTGTAGRGTQAAIESHLDTCESCTALLERERQLSQGLRALSATTAGEVPSDLAERRLLQAFDARRSAQPSQRFGGIRWTQAAAVAVLVSGVLLWSISAWRSRSDVPPESVQSVSNVARPPAQVPGQGAATASTSSVTAPPAAPAARRGRTSQAKGAPSRTVRATGFLAIPGAAGLPAFESGEIVRVEVSLASLPTYGIDILPDVRTDVVEADLLVGQDGQARAIRLVPANDGR